MNLSVLNLNMHFLLNKLFCIACQHLTHDLKYLYCSIYIKLLKKELYIDSLELELI